MGIETLDNQMRDPGATLKIRCGNPECGHQAEWTRETAFRVFGPHAGPSYIRNRMVCGLCDNRRVQVWI